MLLVLLLLLLGDIEHLKVLNLRALEHNVLVYLLAGGHNLGRIRHSPLGAIACHCGVQSE